MSKISETSFQSPSRANHQAIITWGDTPQADANIQFFYRDGSPAGIVANLSPFKARQLLDSLEIPFIEQRPVR